MSSATAPTGREPLTHRRVLGIALPIVISNATVPILGAVDTGVVGQLGEAAPIGAVGLGAIILTSVYWMFGFLRMGTVGLTSQALGARDAGEVSALLTRVLMAGLGFGLLLILLQLPIFALALAIAPGSAEVEALARDYMTIRIWSAPAAIALYGITGWLVAQERTAAILVIQLWTNGVNIVLDLWFVLGLDWGVEGVAFATFLAEWSGAALGLWFCRGVFENPRWRDWPRVFDAPRLKNMVTVNTDILIRSLLLQIIFTSFLFMGADFGDVTLAANQVLLQFLYVTAYALDGFAFAAEALVGQALGAKRVHALRRSAVLTTGWGIVVVIGLMIAFAFGGGWLIDTMAKSPEVQSEARLYLIWMVVAPILGVWSWMFDGIYIGATQTRDMRNMMAISFIIYWAAVFTLIPVWGNHGLWMALIISFVARGITMAWRYPRIEARARA